MTISLVVFVSMQFYWLKEYYTALDQEFENKVYLAMESSTKKIGEIEVNKYYEKFADFRVEVMKFFNNIAEYNDKLSTLLTKNFQIIGT